MERQYGNREVVRRVLETLGQMNSTEFPPMQGDVVELGVERAGYEIFVENGRVKRTLTGKRGEMHAVITTKLPSGELSITGSRTVIQSVEKRTRRENNFGRLR